MPLLRDLTQRMLLFWFASISIGRVVESFVVPKLIPSSQLLHRSFALYSASLEEAESLLYHSTISAGATKIKGNSDDDPGEPPKRIPVRREYETWMWSYTNDPTVSQPVTYKINYRVEGAIDHPPILLVHGFGANLNHYRYQYEPLVQAGYRVYAIDLLGFGASDKPIDAAKVGFSIELFTQQLYEFIKYINIQDYGTTVTTKKNNPTVWTLAGNSIGGLCCLAVAAQIETQLTDDDVNIASIVLFNTSGGMTGFRYDDVPVWARPILAFFQYVVLGPIVGSYFFRNFRSRENVEQILKQSGVYGDRTNVDDELLEILLRPADDHGAEQVFLAVFGGPAGPTAESILPNVKVPVLALWGDTDPWTPINGGLHPGNALPPYHGTNEFVLVPLQGTGHCPHDECPDIVNEKMIAFLKDIATTKDSSS